MKLKVNFVSKTPKVAMANEIIFVKSKDIKNKNLNPILNKVFDNQLFKLHLFAQKEHKNIYHIFVNCSKTALSSD